MKWMPLLMVALLPSVMLAGVIVSSVPANSDSFISFARDAMENEDYVTAFALYECALRRDPQSSEALAGRLMARSFMERDLKEHVQVTSR